MRHRLALVVVAAVIVVALVSTLIALATTGSDDEPEAHARAGRPTTTTAPDTTLRCGTELPVDFAIPAGFRGPVRSVARDAPSLEPGQLSLVWTASDATIEVRWPADAEVRMHVVEQDPSAPTEAAGVSRPLEYQRTASGTVFQQLMITKGDQPIGCQVLQLTVYGRDEGVRRADGALAAQLFVDNVPLITGSEDVSALPDAVACRTPPGVFSPNQGGTVSGAAYESPQDVLSAFIADHATIPKDGYVQFALDDGSVAYGHRDPSGESWITVIHVVSVPGGWAVDHWDASGC